MIFDIEQVTDEGLSLRFQISKAHFDIDQEGCFFNKNIDVNGCLLRIEDDIYFDGNIKTELVLECFRCLKKYNQPIGGSLKTHFEPFNKDSILTGEVELHVSDIDTEVYRDKKIDLTQSIRDKVLLMIPSICLCMDYCRGICISCGVNANEESCDCKGDLFIDPRLEILKKLKNKLM